MLGWPTWAIVYEKMFIFKQWKLINFCLEMNKEKHVFEHSRIDISAGSWMCESENENFVLYYPDNEFFPFLVGWSFEFFRHFEID